MSKNVLIINHKSKRDKNGNSLLKCEVISSENNHGYTCNYSGLIIDSDYEVFKNYIIRRNLNKNTFTIYNDNLKEFKTLLENHYKMTVLSHEIGL